MNMINKVIQVKLLYLILAILLTNILTAIVTNRLSAAPQEQASEKYFKHMVEKEAYDEARHKEFVKGSTVPINDGRQF
jgi:fucose permease